jgi:transketolase
MRTIPGMTIINPADDNEARQAVRAAAKAEGPFYLRFGRLAIPNVMADDYRFEIGKGVQLTEGEDVAIIATGLMVGEAMKAQAVLAGEGIKARVINIATIKPIDKEIICKAAQETGAIVTAEEHNIIGGLGSAVAETVCECGCAVPVVRVGVEDTFGKSGPAVELLKIFGLCAENIVAKAKAAIALKK